MMKAQRYSPRQRFFISISSFWLLILLLTTCGAAAPSSKMARSTASSGAVSATVAMPPTQTSCPAAGTARAAIMPPLALGRQNAVVYSEIQGPLFDPTSVTLKRYTVSTRKTTKIVTLPHTNIYSAQISADGQWVLLYTLISHRGAIQLVRMDGQELQTLYCGGSGGIGWMQWSPDKKYIAFIDVPSADQPQSAWTFNLLNVATGKYQTKGPDSNHVLYLPLVWLNNTHLYMGGLDVDTHALGYLYLLDSNSDTIQRIPIPPNDCFNAASSLDRKHLFTLMASQCLGPNVIGGPSTIQVQPATGGRARTIYSTPTDAITQLAVASSTTLLLIIHNANTETSHNGLWKLNTKGTRLTQLVNDAAIIKDPASEHIGFLPALPWAMPQPWTNASRDGAFYSLEVYFESETTEGPNRLLIGSIHGGAPVTFASSLGALLVGWAKQPAGAS